MWNIKGEKASSLIVHHEQVCFFFVSRCDNINKLRITWKRFIEIVKKCYIRSGQGVVRCLFFYVAAYISELLSVGQMQQKKNLVT